MILKFVNSLFGKEKITHPFVNVKKERDLVYDNVEEVKGLEDVKWGAGLKKARIEQNNISISWEVDGLKKGDRLRGMDLDDFDWVTIREWNKNPDNRKKMIQPNSYKLVKPYVVAGWKYKEIGLVLGYSERWVQDIAPKVKQAMRNRRGGV